MILYYTYPLAFYLIFPLVNELHPDLRRGSPRRIINGNFAYEGQFPFFAEVINFQPEDKTVTCGGALVTARKVITANHCLKNSIGIEVKFGSIKKHQGKSIIVQRKYKHPNMDFVVLLLESSVGDEINVKPVQIIPRPVTPGELCIAIGFGWDGNDYSNEMKFTHLHINEASNVQKLVSYILPGNEIYAGMNDDSDVCFGDSGGPLLCRDGLAGLTLGSILREPCNSIGLPSKFADLYQLQHWIHSLT